MDWMNEADKTPHTPEMHPGFALHTGPDSDPDATSPVMFVDFDGVINAITRPGNKTDRNVWDDYTYVDMPSSVGDESSYPVHYSPTVVAFLHEMVAAGVEVVWLTTWAEDTAYFPEYIGAPVLKWLGKNGRHAVVANMHQRKEWWKLEAVREYAAMRPVIWLDDDHFYNTRKVNDWVNARARYAATLVLAPQTRIGLTKKMLRTVRQFVEVHNK